MAGGDDVAAASRRLRPTPTLIRRRRSFRPLLIFVIFLVLASFQAHAARDTQTFRVNVPTPPSSPSSSSASTPPRPPLGRGFFNAYLPKGVPVTPSGPSKRHNDIGTQSRQAAP